MGFCWYPSSWMQSRDHIRFLRGEVNLGMQICRAEPLPRRRSVRCLLSGVCFGTRFTTNYVPHLMRYVYFLIYKKNLSDSNQKISIEKETLRHEKRYLRHNRYFFLIWCHWINTVSSYLLVTKVNSLSCCFHDVHFWVLYSVWNRKEKFNDFCLFERLTVIEVTDF